MINVNKKFFLLILTFFGSVHIDIKASENEDLNTSLPNNIPPMLLFGTSIASHVLVIVGQFVVNKLLNGFSGSTTPADAPLAPVIIQLKQGNPKNREYLIKAITALMTPIYENKENTLEDFEAVQNFKNNIYNYDEASLSILLEKLKKEPQLSSLRHKMQHLNELNPSQKVAVPEQFTIKNIIENMPINQSPKQKINAVTDAMYMTSSEITKEDYLQVLQSLKNSYQQDLPATTDDFPEAIAQTLWNCMFPNAHKKSLKIAEYRRCKDAAIVMTSATKQNTTPTPPPATKNNNPQPQGGDPKLAPQNPVKTPTPAAPPKSVNPPQQPGTGK